MQFDIVARLGAVALVLTCSGCGGGGGVQRKPQCAYDTAGAVWWVGHHRYRRG